MSRPKVSVSEKIQKEHPDFVNEVASLSPSDLDNRLAQLAKDLEAVEQAKEDDEALEEARDKAVQLNAPYVDGKKMIRLKSRYLIALLKEKGAE